MIALRVFASCAVIGLLLYAFGYLRIAASLGVVYLFIWGIVELGWGGGDRTDQHNNGGWLQ